MVFHLEVSMRADHLTAVRRFVADLTQSVVHDAELASRLAMSTHELLENAVKYSADPRRLVTLQLCAEADQCVQVTVLNVSNAALAASLHEWINRINESADPIASYHQMLTRSMDEDSGSGLGLARIRAEGNMELSCTLRGDMLAVRAQAAIGGGRCSSKI
jgi:hypothetical protein